MEDLVKKHPALIMPFGYIDIVRTAMDKTGLVLTQDDKEYLYKCFKLNINCIGLNPDEYETCIKWFCDTMKYQEVTK